MDREIWVSREYELDSFKKIKIIFYKPVIDLEYSKPNDYTFRSDFEIEGLELGGKFKAYGIDELQAIHLALVSAGNLLYSSKEYADARVTFLGGFDLHLPYSEGIEDLIKEMPKEKFKL